MKPAELIKLGIPRGKGLEAAVSAVAHVVQCSVKESFTWHDARRSLNIGPGSRRIYRLSAMFRGLELKCLLARPRAMSGK